MEPPARTTVLDLPSLESQLTQLLSSPGDLPLHRARPRVWARDSSVPSLLSTGLSAPHTTLSVTREHSSGQLLDYTEVGVVGVGHTPVNSTSMQRTPGAPALSVKGDPTHFPFWPGGMDSVEVVKESLDTTQLDLDRLLNIAPGLSRGLTPNSAHSHPVSVGELLYTGDLLDWKSEAPAVTSDLGEMTSDPGESAPDSTANEVLDELVVPGEEQEVESRPHPPDSWASAVDLSSGITDFESRVPDMAHTWPFQLDPFQQAAVLHLEAHHNVFVAAHTSAGKTVVAEYAIALSRHHMTRAIYTSPIKALSNQKFRDFRLTFGAEAVGLLTGDVQINTAAPCLIMTTEILRSMLYNGSDVIRDVEWVVFDEVHYINDSERGVVWEEVLIMLPDHVSVIMLSATVPNALEFADWVGRTKRSRVYVISTPKRPVPLRHFLYTGNSKQTSDQLFQIVGEDKRLNKLSYQRAMDAKKQRSSKSGGATGPKVKHMSHPKQDKNIWLSLVHMLEARELLPVVGFTFSRARCNENAESLSSLDLTTTTEKSLIHVFFTRSVSLLKGEDRRLPQVLWSRELLKRGLAVHHSGILPIIREVIELLFQRGLVKLLFATETFAMGVNMPARTVIFDSIRKHDGTRMRDLTTGEYIQMAGRAGRRGLDTTGTVILLCKADIPEASELSRMILGDPTILQSQFRLTYSMLLNLLRVETLRVEDMLKRSFAESDSTRRQGDRQEQLAGLREELGQLSLDCQQCSEDIDQYYQACQRMTSLEQHMKSSLLASPATWKLLTPGRVVTLTSPLYGPTLGVVIQTSRHQTLTLLTLCEPDIDETEATVRLFPETSPEVTPRGEPGPLYTPAALNHTVVEIPAVTIGTITTTVLRLDSRPILNDFNTRLTPRLRGHPLPEATVKARQELLSLAAGSQLVALDPVRDIKLNELDYVEWRREHSAIAESANIFKCLHCPHLPQHFSVARQRAAVEGRLSQLEYQLSESSLLLLPEYRQRLEVLRGRGYVDRGDSVLLKGRVTCELHTNEVLLTEIIFQNLLRGFSPAEAAALLSAFVFQQAKCSEPLLTENLASGKEAILKIAEELAESERRCGLNTSADEYKQSLKFGLIEVVHEWANGKEFLEITQLTDVLEGMIVRCIQRLEELCRNVGNAARVIGDPALQHKMGVASSLIKRDIVFAASLYTI